MNQSSRSFQNAQKSEREWWGDCTDTSNEETKQQHYADTMGLNRVQGVGWVGESPIDLEGKSVLDIGGGPVSLLLKCCNRGVCTVLDPNTWPDWVLARYEAAGIKYVKAQAEHTELDQIYDEVWIYNVLQHVEDPKAVITTAKKYGRVVRVFEWLGGVANDTHPHILTKEFLDKELSVEGKVHEPKWERHLHHAYTAVVKSKPPVFRFHLLGLAHVPTHQDVSACAYTQKVFKLAKMLKSLGHTVFFYGGEGSEVECDESIQVVSNQDRIDCYGEYDWHTEFFKHSGTDSCHGIFNQNAIREINARKQNRDFLLCPMGNYDKPIADAVNLMVVESGIGYRGVFSKYRVFESYAWMHYIYGILKQNDGSWYDCVIPNYFDPNDFPYQPKKGDYFLFIGRLVRRKGLDVAVQTTRKLGVKLVVAGQGWLTNEVEGLNITDKHVEHVGCVGPGRRKALMGGAKAVFVPTYYIEPFGGVAVEAMMCGTPVITTDWGAMSETVLHGKTGFRCRTFDDFVWAAQNIDQIRPEDCHKWAIENYSMDRVGKMYQEYFVKLQDLYGEGWYEAHPERKQLDWLRRFYR
jgi:glycosyltransferase involved in cell wall biosynthesis